MPDDTLLNKAAIIERTLHRIEEEHAGQEHLLETDFRRQDAIILNLQRACQAAIDGAMHMVRIHGLGLPQETRQAFTMLEQAKLLSPDLARALRAMVGFRNIAIHDYQDLSLPILRNILESRLDDLRSFASMLVRHDC